MDIHTVKVAKKRKLENDDLSLSILTISGSSGSGSAEICTESIKEQPNFLISSQCDGPCECQAVVEGQRYNLLNLNNRYFIHYAMLYEYSELMTLSRNPLHSYLRAKNRKFLRLGKQIRYLYHIVQHGWNAYLRMIDIDYRKTFSCSICLDNPDVIMDGIMMGTVRKIPEHVYQYDEDQSYQPIPLSERVFITSTDSRKRLQEFCSLGLSSSNFKHLIDSLDFKEFANYIVYGSLNDGERTSISKEYPLVKMVIEHICHQEPISGLFQFSLLTKDEISNVVKLSEGCAIQTKELDTIYLKMYYILKILFNSLTPPESTPRVEDFTLLPIISCFLKAIIGRIDNLFKRPSRKLVEFEAPDGDYFNYFPTFQKNFKLPVYQKESSISHAHSISCTKIYPTHQKFSPGLLVISCRHKICYGFQIMRQRESTFDIFNTLLTLFKILPRIIIYDNACNLHATCTIRDPKVFKNSTFLIDRFHTQNHKCNVSYKMNSVKVQERRNINSQICEQFFSSLRRISTQITYMNIDTMYYNIRYFIACWNLRTT